MNTKDITQTLTTLFGELVEGPTEEGGYMLNRHDKGMLKSLDKLSAKDASRTHDGGASVAAHVNHLRYGLSLMNRWAAGENPFEDADWAGSWEKIEVSDAEWKQLRDELRGEVRQWLSTIKNPRDVIQIELNGMIGSIAHFAYHFGAIRQIDRKLRGPSATD